MPPTHPPLANARMEAALSSPIQSPSRTGERAPAARQKALGTPVACGTPAAPRPREKALPGQLRAAKCAGAICDSAVGKNTPLTENVLKGGAEEQTLQGVLRSYHGLGLAPSPSPCRSPGSASGCAASASKEPLLAQTRLWKSKGRVFRMGSLLRKAAGERQGMEQSG